MGLNQRSFSLPQLLQNFIHEPILELTPSTGSDGDNVIGKMLALKATTLSGKTLHMIVKALAPYNEKDLNDLKVSNEERLFANVIDKYGHYRSELNYYTNVKVQMDKIFPDCTLPVPKVLYAPELVNGNGGLDSTIIMEDLRHQGYKMADKFKGVSLLEFNMVLEAIAKFHAASHVYIMEHPECLEESMLHHCFARSRQAQFADKEHSQYISDIYNGFLDFARSTNQIEEATYKRILNLTNKISHPDKVISTSIKAMQDYFPVFVHGDLHIQNILFKYDEDNDLNPKDVRFIDFQQFRRTSIYDDLHYFVYTSTTKEFRDSNLNNSLNLYYDTFTGTLTHFKYNLESFTQDEFHQGYRKYLDAAFCYAVLAIPFQLGIPPSPTSSNAQENENDKQLGFENASRKDEIEQFAANLFISIRKKCVSGAKNSPIALKRLKQLCMEMEELGVF